jgi:hypothetical protein
MLSALFVSAVLPRLARSQSPPPLPPPRSNSGSSSPPPATIHRNRDDEQPPTIDPHVVLKSYEKDIKRDVGRLLELAQDLKKDADKIPSLGGLNGAMGHKAEEIEKLAHKIAGLARG